MKGLTKRQQEVLEYIQQFTNEKQYSPSYREIMNHFGLSSPATIHQHIAVLKRKRILSDDGTSRSITILKESSSHHTNEIELPFIGYIAAGVPIETLSRTQTFPIPETLVHDPDKTYVLRARGDSLKEEHIVDGDLLIVEARSQASDGELVVVLINKNHTLIKRYYTDGDFIRLEAAHGGHEPMRLRAASLAIQGVVVGLLRLYH